MIPRRSVAVVRNFLEGGAVEAPMFAQTSVGLPASSPGSVFRLGESVQLNTWTNFHVYSEREGQP
jgi:hypothetical protein